MHYPLSAASAKIIDDELNQVRKIITDQLSSGDEFSSCLLADINIREGKMIRPSLALLSHHVFDGKFGPGYTHNDLTLASAVVELIHAATLVHDDVIDQGRYRRGKPTANSLYGNNFAVLLGDFLLSKVFKLCTALKPNLIEIMASATSLTCEGELKQNLLAKEYHESKKTFCESEYIDIITKKSAALFRCSCRIGALLAGADEQQVLALANFGLNTGIAFQITDDLLDISGDELTEGKTLRTDADKNKLTLATIHLLNALDKEEKLDIDYLDRIKNTGSEYIKLLETYGSLEYARSQARRYAAKAVNYLDVIKNSQAKEALKEISEFAASRLTRE
ncbi:MAG: polyprenyl synthetase family protein [Planctomycetota bacterium]|jgi:octaprenyl-diphosphate synthase